MQKLKVFSVCSGVEGLGEPLEQLDLFKLIGFSEIDKHCNAVLRYLYPEVTNYGSITEFEDDTLPDFDVLIGGTPCQNLSIAGNRDGLNGDKSRLFFNFVKILKHKRPTYFIWENVEGTLTSQRGWDFARVQMELADAGYSFRWEVLSADEFGIPQIRTRVFIVGVLRGRGSRKVFCEPKNSSDNGGKTTIKNEDSKKICIRDEDDIKVRTRFNCLDSNYHKGIDNHRQRSFIAYSKSTRKVHLDHRMRLNHTANTLNTGDGCSSQSTSNFILEPNSRLRKLMPIECDRIMSWEPNRTKYGIDEKGRKYEIPDTARYSMCGNGVVSECVKPIGQLILKNELRRQKRESTTSRKNSSKPN